MKTQIRMRAKDFFDILGQEGEQQPKKIPELKKSPTLERIIKKFEKLISKDRRDHLDMSYTILSTGFGTNPISPRDIELFSILFGNYKFKRMPEVSLVRSFFYALIDLSSGKDFVLHTKHYPSSLRYGIPGLANKKIRVNGDVRGDVGSDMDGGEILVNGSVFRGNIGHQMQGGLIEITGDAEDTDIGSFMDGGKIILRGDAHPNAHNPYPSRIGMRMLRGDIYLEGEYENKPEGYAGGNIYHKGKLIVRDGKEVK